MRALRQFGNALLLALISLGLVIGGLSLSLVEFIPNSQPTPGAGIFPSPMPLTVTATLPSPLLSPPSNTTSLPTDTHQPPASCPIPAGWVRILVLPGDTLEGVAARYRILAADLSSANCLLTATILPGSTIYVPPVPASTEPVCNPGAAGWVRTYVIQPGDTLYRIALDHYTTLPLLRQVNCRSGDSIYPGEILWVPNVATRTPIPTFLPGFFTPYPTDPLTETALPFTVTPVSTNTPIPLSPTTAPSATPLPTVTASPTAFP
jgi:LysM repeat protein